MEEIDDSENLLRSALFRLLREESIDRISVTDIVHEAGVSRATFYRHYYDKYMLFNRSYDRALERTLYRFKRGFDWRQATAAIYDEIKAWLPCYQHALKSQDINCYRNYVFRISRDFHLRILAEAGLDIASLRVEKPIESYIHGNLEIMCGWVSGGMVEPIASMQEIFDMCIPEAYARYFVQRSA